jgi:hypothetical protein
MRSVKLKLEVIALVPIMLVVTVKTCFSFRFSFRKIMEIFIFKFASFASFRRRFDFRYVIQYVTGGHEWIGDRIEDAVEGEVRRCQKGSIGEAAG